MQKKGQAVKILIWIIIGLVVAAIMIYIATVYVGGGAKSIFGMGPNHVTQCQEKGRLEEAGVGREFVDTDGDGSPNHCDVCRTTKDGPTPECDDKIDNDNDGMPDGCDEDENDEKKNKGITKGNCKYNKFAKLG